MNAINSLCTKEDHISPTLACKNATKLITLYGSSVVPKNNTL